MTDTGYDEMAIKVRIGLSVGRLTSHAVAAFEGELRRQRDRQQDALDDALRGADAANAAAARLALGQINAAGEALRECRAWASRPVGAVGATIVGSDDPLLGRLAHQTESALRVTGSFGGLWALARGETDLAALHLRDPDSREYNTPYLRRMVPEGDLVLVNLAWRESGLLLAPGNPLDIRRVGDLARAEVRLVNRQPSAGTRLMLFLKLREAGIDPHGIAGWNHCVVDHESMAAAIRAGDADAGPGLRASAEAHGLTFLPLTRERYDLVMKRSYYESGGTQVILDALGGERLARAADGLAGYDLSQAGNVVGTVH